MTDIPKEFPDVRAQRGRIEALSVAIRWVAIWIEPPAVLAQTIQALEMLLGSPHLSPDDLELLCVRWHAAEWQCAKAKFAEQRWYTDLVAEAAKQEILGPPC